MPDEIEEKLEEKPEVKVEEKPEVKPAPVVPTIKEEIEGHDARPDVVKWLEGFESRVNARFEKLETKPEQKVEVKDGTQEKKPKPKRNFRLWRSVW